MKSIRSIIAIVVASSLCFTSINFPVYAQTFVDPMPKMPAAGVMVPLSYEFTPAYLKGIVIHPENALKFDFIIFKGDKKLTDEQKRVEYTKLTKYFLASLAIPDDDQWVNLSPYEKGRIIKGDFGKTEMGRDLLAQDYMLKQITASLIYPEDQLGKKFWDRVYAAAQAQYGTTNVPINTFNKVWILPDDALIYEKGNAAYVLKNHLKVMMEEDYLSLKKHTGIQSVIAAPSSSVIAAPSSSVIASEAKQSYNTHSLASQIVKQIILPALEREVNEGKNFAAVRQVFSGVVLAAWYKRVLKESLLGKIYMNKSRVKGVDQDPQTNEKIYRQYLRAYRKGVFNFIKEDVDKYTHEIIPRKYFSGGLQVASSYNKGVEGINGGKPVLEVEKTATPAQNEAMVSEVQSDDMAKIAVAESQEATSLSAIIARAQATNPAMTSQGVSRQPLVFVNKGDAFVHIDIRQGNSVKETIRKVSDGYHLEETREFLDTDENNKYKNKVFKAGVTKDGNLMLQALERDVTITKVIHITPGEQFVIKNTESPINVYRVNVPGFKEEKFKILSSGEFFSQTKGVLKDDVYQYPGFVVKVQRGELTIKNSLGSQKFIFLDVDLNKSASQTPANAAMTVSDMEKLLNDIGVYGMQEVLEGMLEAIPLDKQGEIRNKMKEAEELFNVDRARAVEAYLEALESSEKAIAEAPGVGVMMAMPVRELLGGPGAIGVDGVEGILNALIKSFPPSDSDQNKIKEMMSKARELFKNEKFPEAAELYKAAFVFSYIAIENATRYGGTKGQIGDAAMISRRLGPYLTELYLASFIGMSDARYLAKKKLQPLATEGRVQVKLIHIQKMMAKANRLFQDKQYQAAAEAYKETASAVKAMEKNGNGELSKVFQEFLSLANDNKRYSLLVHQIRVAQTSRVSDKAMIRAQETSVAKSNPLGGIDFNAANLNLQIKRDGHGVPLPISQQNLESIHIDGLIPVVLAIYPAAETSLLSELQLSGTV